MQPGVVLGGRYRIERIAGAGGMGTVYRARDETCGEPCAVKVLAEDASARTRERFLVEAAVLAKVSHPAIVRYVDHGAADGMPFLVMEWVDGESLADRIARGTTPAEALRLGERLALALTSAHAAGVVHRDVKPRNVMLPNGSFDAAKIVDFGVARVQSDAGGTKTGARIGTPRYMAPEQIVSSRRVDGRADVFSLGCVMFEMLTGRRAFRGRDEVALLARMVIEDAPRVRSVRPDVPEEIDALVARMLTRDYKKRPFATEALAREIREALGPASSMGPVVAQSEGDERTADETAGDLSLDTGGEPLPPPSELPWATIGRDDDLARLERALAPGVVAGLWGPLGVGKSHVAQALARSVWQARGAVVVDLRGARDEAELLRRVGAELGVLHAPTGDDVCASVTARGGPLVVLDSCDGVVEHAVGLARRIVAEGAASVLVVSRARPAPLGDAMELEPLDVLSSVMLLVARSRGTASLERDRDALASIATKLQGNALALTLAASRTSVLGVDVVAKRVDRSLELLGDALRDAAQGVWETLTEEERLAAAACAIFPNSIRPELAEKVCDAAMRGGALDALDALRDKSLLRAGPRGTLVMDATLRELARSKRAEHEARLADAEWAFARGSVEAAPSDLGELFAVEDDLLASAELAIARGDAELALGAAIALEPALSARGPLDRLASLIDRAESLAHERTTLRARARAARGRVACLTRDFALAESALREALDMARGDAELEASTWLDLGVMYQAMEDFAAAERCYVTVLDVHDTVASRSEARARGNLGALAHDRGELDLAYSHDVRAIAVAESIGDARLLGVFLSNLAVLDRERGHAGSARQRFVRALHAMEDARDRRLIGIALGNLGMLELEEGRTAAALAVFERSAEMLAALGDLYSAALAQARLAAALAISGEPERADRAIARAEKLTAGDERTLAIVRFFRAFPEVIRAERAERERDDGEESAAFLDRARARARSARALAKVNDDVRVALRVLARFGVE